MGNMIRSLACASVLFCLDCGPASGPAGGAAVGTDAATGDAPVTPGRNGLRVTVTGLAGVQFQGITNGEITEFSETEAYASIGDSPGSSGTVFISARQEIIPRLRMIDFYVPNAVGTTRCFEDNANNMSQNIEAQFDDINRSSSAMEQGHLHGNTSSLTGVGVERALVGECSVTITQVAAAIGDYWIGTFTGRLVSEFNENFMVTGDFRLRRRM